MNTKELYEKIQNKLSDDICILLDKENMSASDLDTLGKAVDVLKDISTITAMDNYEYEDDGYSKTYAGRRSMMTQPNMDYDIRPGNHASSSNGWGNRPYYSRSGNSVSEQMVNAMERMYDTAGSEHDRAKIDEVMHYIRNNM